MCVGSDDDEIGISIENRPGRRLEKLMNRSNVHSAKVIEGDELLFAMLMSGVDRRASKNELDCELP